MFLSSMILQWSYIHLKIRTHWMFTNLALFFSVKKQKAVPNEQLFASYLFKS
ncbi:hypothetical protein HBHAL_3527 [Halobacillus halophilus DSM 2266]|uniref:Uncharacterized protein n=1 Tax=Halobacillus halophilus (strain ATCC 35676 / DSM 2266 / JCM 20832 / KCTC 3685 / LMG 17431 / NBRC 102448 / NCIMB 2269) TaxID=866895 RepID=I0JP03_HALH3|nr:hypothetical protein HBHAL_3527 [Halobacillus halophilus DSM 2266]